MPPQSDGASDIRACPSAKAGTHSHLDHVMCTVAHPVIASAAKQSIVPQVEAWIASLRSQ
ncbi:hypothetical protein ACVJGD_005150 [Bradyrhizobium sp. USDA 10063]